MNTNAGASTSLMSSHIWVVFAIGLLIMVTSYFATPHLSTEEATWPRAQGVVTDYYFDYGAVRQKFYRTPGRGEYCHELVKYDYVVDGIKRTRVMIPFSFAYLGDPILLRYPPGHPEKPILEPPKTDVVNNCLGFVLGGIFLLVGGALAYSLRRNP